MNKDPKQLVQIDREVKFFSQLAHNNIVNQFEIFQIQDQQNKILVQYSVMELLSPLSDLNLVSMNQKDRNEICTKIAIDLLLALEYLSTFGATHEGLVHRDIKEDNIMILRSGNNFQTKIIDFNMARIVSGSSFTVRAGNMLHRAPECWSNDPVYSTASDLWSVGILLFYLVTGQQPYPNEASMQTQPNSLQQNFSGTKSLYKPNQSRIVRGEVDPVPQYVSEPLKTLIIGILNKDPTQRGRDARVAAMNAFLQQCKDIVKPRCSTEQQKRLFADNIQYIKTIDDYGVESELEVDAVTMNTQFLNVRTKNKPTTVLVMKVKKMSQYKQEEVQQMQNRIEQQKKINHKNIAKIYNAFIKDNVLYTVSDKLYPLTSTNIINSQVGSVDQERVNIHQQREEVKNAMLMKVAIDILLAIKHMEKLNISHGQITKSNVMMQNECNQDFTIKLISPNIDRDIATQYFTIRGNMYYYMPNEFFQGMSSQQIHFDTAIDLWQLGILLHELCTGGAFPYSSKKNSYMFEDALPLPDDIHPEIKQLIFGLLNRQDRQARIKTMNNFLTSDRNLTFVCQRSSKQQFDEILKLKRSIATSGEDFGMFGEKLSGNPQQQYRVVKTLCTGPKSTVYLAQNLMTSEICAVKYTLTANKTDMQKAQSESILLQQLKEKTRTMIQTSDSFETADEVYIVQEFLMPFSVLQLQSCPEHVRNQMLQSIAVDLLLNISCLERLKIVHRDIKLDDVMVGISLNSDFIAKIIDFGEAAASDSKGLTEVGVRKYRAPECWGGSPLYSTASDLWAVGVVLYELSCIAHGQTAALKISIQQDAVNILRNTQIPNSFYLKELIQGLLGAEPKTRVAKMREHLKIPQILPNQENQIEQSISPECQRKYDQIKKRTMQNAE